ncbi:MAG: HAD-IIIA family hydrolase [Gammaproteobacteria bacterium]|nr:HAD-IIIA family hydrolase [Gammaproteobacteria bacterium]
MQAVILGGGKGVRLGALASGSAKPLIDVGGKPFAQHLIDNLRRFGFTDIVILAGPFARDYAARLADAGGTRLQLHLVPEDEPAGTAGALLYAQHLLQPEFLLLNGDSFFDINLLDLAMRGHANDKLATLALVEADNTERYGGVKLDGDSIARFDEKIAAGRGVVNAGIYWLRRDILSAIRTPPISFEHSVLPLLAKQHQVAGVIYRANFIDIGVPDDLMSARESMPKWLRRPTAFLTRGCILSRADNDVCRSAEFVWLPGAQCAIKRLNDHGYLVVGMATNETGIASGFCDVDAVEQFHRRINVELVNGGAHIDAVYCDGRKPASGLLLRALHDWSIDCTASFMIGDQDVDLQTAWAAHIKGVPATGNIDELIRSLIGEA